MTEDQLRKYKFTHSMILEYTEPRTKFIIPCILTSVDFDEGIFKLWVIPSDNHEGNEIIIVNHEHVFLPKRKTTELKVI